MRTLITLLLASVSLSGTPWYQDWEAYAWRANVQTVGALNGNTYIASTRWFLQTRSAGLRGSIKRASFMAGPTQVTARIPCIRDLGNATDALTGADPTYSEVNGMTFTSGGGDMLSTGLNPTNLPLSSASLGIYLGGTPGPDANVPIGTQFIGAGNYFSMVASINPGVASVNIWNPTGAPAPTDTNGTGWYMGSRISAAVDGVSIYRNGTMLARSTAVSGAQVNTAGSDGIFVMGLNNSGAPILATSKAGRGYQIALGFTDAQSGASAKIWQRFQTALNRAVVP
jgi:hypothetical protein